MNLLRRIERHLVRSRTPPTAFGRGAIGDPRLVFDLRRGRCLRGSTAARIEAYLTECEATERHKCRR